MNIYEKIAINILYYMDKLQKDEEFQKQCPGITAGEYLVDKTGIKPKRLNNILTGKGKTRLDEIYKIAMVLNMKISDIITQEVKRIEDYHLFIDEYLTIRLDDKNLIQEKKVGIKHVINNEFEEEVAKLLKPKTIDDYVKIISLAHGTRVWKENQDELFKDGKIDIHSVISNREDVYEYLIQHSIEHDVAIDIVKQMSKARTSSSNEL